MSSPPRLRDILSKSAAYLKQKGVDSPRLSAEVVVAHALGMERLGLYLDLDRLLTEQDLSRIRPVLTRRGTGEPVAYILGRKEFYGLEFLVTRDVLIPRPETELGVDLARKRFRAESPVVFADVGVGSGALAVALLVHLPLARCLGTDRSQPALAVARANCAAHNVQDRIRLVRADLLSCTARESLDLVVANLPYLSETEFSAISHEITGFEPKAALVAGPQGDELFGPMLGQAMTSLKHGGCLLMETGCSQAEAVAEGLRTCSSGWRDVLIFQDAAGLNRYVQACWFPLQKKNNTSVCKPQSSGVEKK